jgi:ATP-dependent helicase HrpA
VPGLREELVTALIKTLPKPLRRLFAPAPDHARAVLARLQADSADGSAEARREPLLDGLERELGQMRSVTIPRDAWELARLPEHLTVTFRVVDERGREIARGTDLGRLRHDLAPKVREELATAGADIEATGLTTWSLGTLPREIGVQRGPHRVTGYPGLVDRGTSVDVRVFPTAAERDPAHRRGVRRLLLLETPSPARQVTRNLDNAARLALSRTPHGSLAALLDDCVTASVDALITAAGGPAWDAESYARLHALTRAKLESTTVRVLDSVRAVLTTWHRVQARISELTAPVLADARRELVAQVDALIRPGFVTAAGTARLGDLTRYLQAVELRIDKLRADPARDAEWTAQVQVVAEEYAAELAALPTGVEPSPELREIGWMIEELRVALYAHPMRTRYPVSVKRIQKALDE